MKQLGILVTTLALSTATLSPARADTSAAESAFARAKKLFTERSYREAIEAFEEAYRLRPHFFVQCSIARCYQNMNDYLKSAKHYRRCLAEGAGAAKIGARVRKSLDKVEGRLASIEVKSPGEGGVVHVDGREIQAAPVTLPVNPGSHVVEVRRAGATPARKTLHCSPGGSYTLSLAPKARRAARPEPRVTDRPGPTPGAVKRKPLHQGWFWGAVALTTALSVTFAVLGSRTVSAHTDYYDNPTEEGYDSFVSRKALTNVFVGLAAAAAASSAVLFFFTDFGGAEPSEGDEDRVVTVGLGLRGTF